MKKEFVKFERVWLASGTPNFAVSSKKILTWHSRIYEVIFLEAFQIVIRSAGPFPFRRCQPIFQARLVRVCCKRPVNPWNTFALANSQTCQLPPELTHLRLMENRSPNSRSAVCAIWGRSVIPAIGNPSRSSNQRQSHIWLKPKIPIFPTPAPSLQKLCQKARKTKIACKFPLTEVFW